MMHHVLAANVDDERELRLERGQIREILIRRERGADATWARGAKQLRDHVLQRVLVRDEIVGTEIPAWLREVVDELPELGIRELARNSRRLARRRDRSHC